ncbi:hypothetical protein E6P74_00600 [Moraxella lacunata]|nr:hypothetical protein [Moraxella lacunata]MDI4506345.1 hypothetical protein [Moraxella lacunata]
MVMMTDKAPNLRSFQREFGDYIRKQKHDDGDTVSSRVGQLYQHLIYNNISGFINQCFPITRKIIEVHFGASLWQNLIKDFIKHGDMTSPYFSEINEQFVGYLTDDVLNKFSLPLYLSQFVHYEWMELYVDNLPNDSPKLVFIHQNEPIIINHTAQILYYEWMVQDISVSFLPNKKQPTFLVVYRQCMDNVFKTAFMAIDQLTFIILTFIQEKQKQGVCYQNTDELLLQLQKTFELNDEILNDIKSSFDDLLNTMLDNQIFYKR